MSMRKFAVLLGARDIVIKKIEDGEKFDFRRLNPTRIGPHLKSLLIKISATNKTMNSFIRLKFEVKGKLFSKILYQKSNSYIVLANADELKRYFMNKKHKYRELDFSVYEKNFPSS